MMDALSPALERLKTTWDQVIAGFLEDGSERWPQGWDRWFNAYRGWGEGEVQTDVFPDPYIGLLNRPPAGVVLGLNPGKGDPRLQGSEGLFAEEIQSQFGGSHSRWAASAPYFRPPWSDYYGINQWHANRLQFLQRWHQNPLLVPSDMFVMELYPWHSGTLTARLHPDPGIIRDFVWEPVAELASPGVFAFGKEWVGMLEDGLGLPILEQWGSGGRPWPGRVPSRSVAVFEAAARLRVVVEWHPGSAGPPAADEVEVLRSIINA
jgi:hypothetical protein